MASSSQFRFIIGVILLFILNQVFGGQIIYEEGYTVSTVIDGNALQINPHSVFSLDGSSSDLIILDSVKSTFYTVSFSNSLESKIKKLSGNRGAGYSDGDLGSAMFNKPKSFTVDSKNNIYVADQTNHVIRKISKSGVTTIAGGYTQKTGNLDGPAQNASFSADFELAFIPQRCALLISDRGNRLIRQIDLKSEDCNGSSSGPVLGSTAAWVLGLGVACLTGLIVGLAIRPYVLPCEALDHRLLRETWRRCLINPGKQTLTFFFDIRNAIVSYKPYQLLKRLVTLCFSQFSLMFGLNIVNPRTTPAPYVSLLDCDSLGIHETTKTQVLVDELSDLLTLDGTHKPTIEQENAYEFEEKDGGFLESKGKIDELICANVARFVEGCERASSNESR